MQSLSIYVQGLYPLTMFLLQMSRNA